MPAIPAALQHLLQRLADHPDLADVQTIDGSSVEDVETERLLVGVSTEEVLPVEGTERSAGLGSTRETFDIVCVIEVFTGDVDVAPVRARAFELLGHVKQAIHAQGLGPQVPVGGVWVTDVSYAPTLSTEGVQVNVQFSIRVNAFS